MISGSLSGTNFYNTVTFSVNGSNTSNPLSIPSGANYISPFNIHLLNSDATTGTIIDFMPISMTNGFNLNMSVKKPNASSQTISTRQIINLAR